MRLEQDFCEVQLGGRRVVESALGRGRGEPALAASSTGLKQEGLAPTQKGESGIPCFTTAANPRWRRSPWRPVSSRNATVGLREFAPTRTSPGRGRSRTALEEAAALTRRSPAFPRRQHRASASAKAAVPPPVGQREAAAERAAVADRGVGDVRDGFGDERQVLAHLGGALDLGMSAQRADAHRAVAHFDARESLDSGDVDQQLGRGEPQVERRDQALAAGEICAGALEEGRTPRQRTRFRYATAAPSSPARLLARVCPRRGE